MGLGHVTAKVVLPSRERVNNALPPAAAPRTALHACRIDIQGQNRGDEERATRARTEKSPSYVWGKDGLLLLICPEAGSGGQRSNFKLYII